MPSRFQKQFATLASAGKKGFIPCTLLGYPDRDTSVATAKCMIDAGATALELGMAFSDPLADGPVLSNAATSVVASGFSTQDAFDTLSVIRQLDADIPIAILVYFNTVLSYGVDGFFAASKKSGADAVLIVDLPPEAAAGIGVTRAARENQIEQIFIVSPITSADRLPHILKDAGAFVYVVSRLGITGSESRYASDLEAVLARVHAQTNLPACVGFGVSTPEQAQYMIACGADGVITGSRLLEILDQSGVSGLQPYLEAMAQATRRAGQLSCAGKGK